MSSLVTFLGLRSPSSATEKIPTLAPFYLSFHFYYAYCILAPRHLKQIYGFDHNSSPREDLSLHGDAAVKSGKITPKMLRMMKRNESCQLNSTENYVLFVGAMSLATLAHVPNHLVNRAGLIYTLARFVYAAVYIGVESDRWSLIRSVAWWVGNGSCLWLLNRAGKKMNMI